MKTIKLQDIIDAMEMQSIDCEAFLNIKTSEITFVTSEESRISEQANEDDDFSEYPDWQRDSIKAAQDVLINWGSGKYVRLPNQRDIHEYRMIEDFCGSLGDARTSDALYAAIQGRGAFRRFKDAICRYDVEQAWYKFRDDAYRKKAIEWCESHHILYEGS